MVYNWPDINLTEFQEAKTFANGLLRGSVEFNEVDHATLTSEGNLRFKIDYERNATKTPSFRVEFTEAPWMKRFADGTTDEYIWEYIFPSDYKKALTPVSIFQMYSRWTDGGGVMCQLELSREGQITGAKQGQIQMIYNAGPDKYRELTPFNPGPGERVHFKVTCKHGVDGYLKVEINELIVFDRLCNTVFMSNPEANAQAKWGIYHHALKGEFGPSNNQLHVFAGHKTFELKMSSLTINRNMTSSDIRYGSSKQYQARIYYPAVTPKGIINMYHGLGEVGKGLNAVEVHEIPKLFRLGIDKDYIVVAPYLASGSSWPKNQLIATLELLSDLKDQHKLENLICTGLSLGGIATIASIYWAYTEAGIDNFFTAAVVVCGKTGSTDMTPFLKTPIRWYHGTEDKTISINNARTFYNRLRAEGGEITLIEYQGMGHAIWSKAYNDEPGNFWDWIKRFDVINTPYVEVVQNMVVISGELYCFTDLNKYKVNATLTKV